ncbi:unnamed protein product [Protopolystoma xenopodis]|uniref:Transferrin receptor-like dimerisation domain-containing protein n=1 Tax=Protopolystoma xenopodis TaxID=117903 RepID=A0A448XG82_9PLAT|nr:unnamed protein product [Protopolystoma xenopodis]
MSVWWGRNRTGLYFPPSELANQIDHLAQTGSASIYQSPADGSVQASIHLGRKIIDHLNSLGSSWSLANDLLSYQVNFAGFNLTTFPAPWVGGNILSSLLSNLDFLQMIRPLSMDLLSRNDANVTASLLHRILELAQLAVAKASQLNNSLSGE